MSTDVPNTLVYVERELILPVAVKLVGSSLATKNSENLAGGINWLVTTRFGLGSENSAETRLADLFPEDIFSFAYPKIRDKDLRVRGFAKEVSERRVAPPDVVSVNGVLRLPELGTKARDPFSPDAVEVQHTHKIYGFNCFTGILEDDGFRIPLYFLLDSARIVSYAHEKPVEVVGVAKWSPTYEVAGHAVNCSLLVAALLLRR
ncbi:hypothetical protein [Nonomuraea sp. NEAU-A123]|uniref:hypothetical protein n=1 Tax=Nonomuraea sp. NEAU-A123 TaxID=2839649 RepID=UPI001BE43950|nr:hypothetical protein [Nonomuraea sp. NEAU-A123]MBT2229418.1 hypothetical protein [Nonomuraea sp. NEAU-A123]